MELRIKKRKKVRLFICFKMSYFEKKTKTKKIKTGKKEKEKTVQRCQ